MKTTKITVHGVTRITSKKSGKDYTVVHFTYFDGSNSTYGQNVGSLWLDGIHEFVLLEEREGILGYDRRGNYGVVDLI